MTKREFASIILKLLGVYALLQALPYFQAMGVSFIMLVVERLNDSLQIWSLVGLSVSFLMAVITGTFLLVSSDKISRFIIGDDNEVPLPCPLSAVEFQAICFSAVGVLIFLGFGLPRFAQFVTDIWYFSKPYAGDRITQGDTITEMWHAGASAAMTCGLAVILFFRAKGLADFWHRIQIARYVKIEDTESKG